MFIAWIRIELSVRTREEMSISVQQEQRDKQTSIFVEKLSESTLQVLSVVSRFRFRNEYRRPASQTLFTCVCIRGGERTSATENMFVILSAISLTKYKLRSVCEMGNESAVASVISVTRCFSQCDFLKRQVFFFLSLFRCKGNFDYMWFLHFVLFSEPNPHVRCRLTLLEVLNPSLTKEGKALKAWILIQSLKNLGLVQPVPPTTLPLPKHILSLSQRQCGSGGGILVFPSV